MAKYAKYKLHNFSKAQLEYSFRYNSTVKQANLNVIY